MRSILQPVLIRSLSAAVALVAVGSASAAGAEATVLRLFLSDGTALVSYGEYARVEDRVIFSMPVGGSAEDPRLHVVSIPAAAVDWERTDRYAASARYQQYVSTRAEEDFARLSNEVARVLNEVALAKDPVKALRIAEQARQTLSDWPRQHYGYRQREVREIVGLLDESISELRARAGVGAFDLSFVAMTAEVPLEPVQGMPAPAETVRQVLAVAKFAQRSAERVALLQSALALLNEAGAAIPGAAALRTSIAANIREELVIDEKYARMSRRWVDVASRAASRARVREVEAALARIAREDERLGRRRPDVVQALNATVRAHLETARRLRLMRDRWLMRRAAYREYEDSVSSAILQLVKAQPALDAIKRLEGPPPAQLRSLGERLAGGADRLQRLTISADLREIHDMLVSAWRFAETAVDTRQEAIGSGEMPKAWHASSAAAGALMMLSRLQGEIRRLLEPPQLR